MINYVGYLEEFTKDLIFLDELFPLNKIDEIKQELSEYKYEVEIKENEEGSVLVILKLNIPTESTTPYRLEFEEYYESILKKY